MADAFMVTRSTYDLIAPEFARAQALAYPELDADMQWLSDQVPPAGRIADVGCGPGRDLALLRARGLRAVGIDLSEAMLRTGGHAGVIQADMRRLPLRDDCLDGIWCQAALLHVPHQHVPAVLAEFARVTRPGGALHLVVAEGDGERWEIGAYGTQERRWFAYHRREPLAQLLNQAGFTILAATHRTHGREWLGVRARKPV
jgi:ubiquinone/menaquinone biosynthesis C-methylase UbiE